MIASIFNQFCFLQQKFNLFYFLCRREYDRIVELRIVKDIRAQLIYNLEFFQFSSLFHVRLFWTMLLCSSIIFFGQLSLILCPMFYYVWSRIVFLLQYNQLSEFYVPGGSFSVVSMALKSQVKETQLVQLVNCTKLRSKRSAIDISEKLLEL